MKLKSFLIIFLIYLPFSLGAQPTFYGKLWITLESQDTFSGTEIELENNASRIGFKDTIKFNKEAEFIYQVEYEINPVDGKADEKKDRTLKQRNSFLGIKGAYGTFFFGTHDTSFKRSSSKIDLFNDLEGDIKNILHGENRMQDLLGYKSPLFGGGFSITLNTIKENKDFIHSLGDSTSISINYKSDSLYASLSKDSDIKGYNNTRLSIGIPFSGTKLGFIYQDSKNLITREQETGYVITASREIDKNSTLKVQLAKSDMKYESGRQISLGYDYLLKKNVKIFFLFSDFNESSKLKYKEVGAIGFEYKF